MKKKNLRVIGVLPSLQPSSELCLLASRLTNLLESLILNSLVLYNPSPTPPHPLPQAFDTTY